MNDYREDDYTFAGDEFEGDLWEEEEEIGQEYDPEIPNETNLS